MPLNGYFSAFFRKCTEEADISVANNNLRKAAICQNYEYLNLHLVLAYRDFDIGEARLNLAKLPKSDDILIELDGLNYEDIERYSGWFLSRISNIKTI